MHQKVPDVHVHEMKVLSFNIIIKIKIDILCFVMVHKMQFGGLPTLGG